MTDPRYWRHITSRTPAAVHEGGGHTAEGCLLGCPPSRTSLHSDGGGLTVYEGARSHRLALMTCLAGHVAETLLLPPAYVSVERSAGDFEAASRHALAIAMTCDHVTAATKARAAKLRGEPAKHDEPSALSSLTRAQIEAAVAERTKVLFDRRVARAGRIIAAAEASVRELLSANPCVMRTLAAALEKFGELDEAALLETFELGRMRQADDDERYGGKRA